MKTSVRQIGHVSVVDISGKITIGEGDVVLREKVNELLDNDQKHILLNLEKVSYMDSAGIGELVASSKLAERVASEVKLVNVQDQVRHILELSMVLPMLDVHDNEEQALAAFGNEGASA